MRRSKRRRTPPSVRRARRKMMQRFKTIWIPAHMESEVEAFINRAEKGRT